MSSILIVDDAAICREPMAAILRRAGFRVLCAEDGQEALAAVRAQQPDLILLDVMMPNMDGFQFLKALRGAPPTRHTPVILLTAMSGEKFVRQAGEYAVQEYLLKASFSVDDLLTRIHKCLDRAVDPEAPSSVEFASRSDVVHHLQQSGHLRTFAGSVAEVIAAATSSRTTTPDIAASIKKDPVLTARVLQLSNSAAMARHRGAVSDLEEAVRILGVTAVRNLAATVRLFDAMPASADDGFNMVRCWQHCLAVASIMHQIMPEAAAGNSSEPYLIGLCHELGEIVCRQYFPAIYKPLTEGEPEPRLAGLSRKDLLLAALGELQLPEEIHLPIRQYLEESNASNGAIARMSAGLRIADQYAHGLLIAASLQARVAPLATLELREVVGAMTSVQLDAEKLWSEISAATATVVPGICGELRLPGLQRTQKRVWYSRHPVFASFDPVAAALQSLAVPSVISRLPASAEELQGYDALVVAMPANFVVPPSLEQVIRAKATPDRQMLPVLYLCPEGSAGQIERPGDVDIAEYPVALSELAGFISKL